MSLSSDLRDQLAQAGDPARALAQQAYAKSELPFHGVPMAQVRTIAKARFATLALTSRAEWEAQVLALWDHATHREERYAALTLAREPAYGQYRDAKAFPLWEHLVTTGAWWDLCDEISAHLVGDSLERDRQAATPILRKWAKADQLWLRRVAILAQLGDGPATDLALLTEAIEANLADSTFWLRKAIGWALRDYARTDPEWVRAQVAGYGPRLTPLSRREAMKHLTKKEA